MYDKVLNEVKARPISINKLVLDILFSLRYLSHLISKITNKTKKTITQTIVIGKSKGYLRKRLLIVGTKLTSKLLQYISFKKSYKKTVADERAIVVNKINKKDCFEQ